ncbi:MAG TPA: succinate dehydrogenase [Candidatus Dormibacteraeota bacterium]|nr:succinate dehydrogenase [Candidatus Dormibacteraeota bacterium]
MSLITRSGRAKPQGGGLELAVWYLIRVSGLGLFVLALAHFSILHFLFDPANQNADFIAGQRWNSLIWRALDWLLLMLVLFHSFLGVRTVVTDYVKGGARTAVLTGLYLVAAMLFVLGSIVVLTLPLPSGG